MKVESEFDGAATPMNAALQNVDAGRKVVVRAATIQYFGIRFDLVRFFLDLSLESRFDGLERALFCLPPSVALLRAAASFPVFFFREALGSFEPLASFFGLV